MAEDPAEFNARAFEVTGEHHEVPVVEHNAVTVPGGELAVVVEYRWLTTEILTANRARFGQPPPSREYDDRGVSLHVFSADRAREYLRFDCFDHEPHYHYFKPDDKGFFLVNYDAVAGGPMLPWALRRLRTRISEMLAVVGADDVAARVDPLTWSAAINEAERLANLMEAHGAPIEGSTGS